MTGAETTAEPGPVPTLDLRFATDLTVSQIPWWAEKVTVLAGPADGGTARSPGSAWRLIRQAAKCDVFISASVRNALVIGLFKRVAGRQTPLVIVTEMRLDDPRPGIAWRLKVALQRLAYASVDVICVSARREAGICAERLRVPIERFQFIPWHTNVLDPRLYPLDGGYVFAAGRTGRDWQTLAAAARKVRAPFTVVCSERDAHSVPFPDNVTVVTDAPYQRYRQLLERAALVVVPLEPHAYSSGQVVILEAMALGKPVIATRVLGTEDYIAPGQDGMLVAPGDADELADAVTRVLCLSGYAEGMGRAALARVLSTHTLEQYVRNIICVAETVARAKGTAASHPASAPAPARPPATPDPDPSNQS